MIKTQLSYLATTGLFWCDGSHILVTPLNDVQLSEHTQPVNYVPLATVYEYNSYHNDDDDDGSIVNRAKSTQSTVKMANDNIFAKRRLIIFQANPSDTGYTMD